MRQALLCALLGLASSTACAGPLDAAKQAFDEGRYPQAMAALRHLEPSPPWSDQARRHALYRGLTHLALGDVHAASRWLTLVKRQWDMNHESLDQDDADRLLTAWRTLGHMPGQPND